MYLLTLSDSDIFKKDLYLYLIAFCFFIILTLIKNEGFILLLILFTATFFIKLYRRELRKDISKLIFLSFSFLPIILWNFFCYSKGIDHEFVHSNILFNLLSRSGDLNNYQLISYFFLLNEKFLITLTFFLVSFWVKWNKDLFSFVFIIITMYIFILFFVSLSTPYDIYWQLNSSAARVIKSLSFFLAFFGLYNLNNKKISYK